MLDSRTATTPATDEALRNLQAAVEHDPTLIEAYFLIGRLNMLPLEGADPKRFRGDDLIELLDDDPSQKSEALRMRSRCRQRLRQRWPI